MVKTGLDIVEEKGNFASRNYYDTLMSIEQETNNKLQQELSSLNSAFNEAMSKGTIQENSSSWVEMRKRINEVTEAILESDKALLEYKNDMRENDWKIFDWLQDRISDTTAEADFMVDLLSNNESELFSKKSGQLTEKGKTVGALHATNYNVYMNQADQYAAKVKEINQELASDPSNTKLIEQKQEYIKAQQDSIKSAQEEKSAVKELISDSYDKMLEILQKLIEKRKEFLDAEKDVYEYQTSIKEKTDNIASLKKQLTALGNDDSEEAQSKKQTLNKDLKDAEKDLEETEYDKWLEDQEKMLDSLYDSYEEILNERLDHVDELLSGMIESSNENASVISSVITSEAEKVGYTITDGLDVIWNDTNNGVGKVLADYSTNFTNIMTTTNTYINSIRALVQSIVDKANGESGKNTGGTVKPTVNTNNHPTPPHNQQASGNGRLEVGDVVTFNGRYFYDSNGNSRHTGGKYSGVKNGVVIDKINSHAYGIHLKSADGRYPDLGWVRRDQVYGFSSGGYTGQWDNGSEDKNGKLAFLHQKELILNKGDTENFLQALELTRDLFSNNLNKQRKLLSSRNNTVASNNNITMNIELPNVQNYNDFVDKLQRDKRFENIIQSMTIGNALGKNSLNKLKFK